jgi:hypothetical protein
MALADIRRNAAIRSSVTALPLATQKTNDMKIDDDLNDGMPGAASPGALAHMGGQI